MNQKLITIHMLYLCISVHRSITNPRTKIEIENKDKLKTNHWKYYETKPINKSNESQTKPTHKLEETQTNPHKKNETHRKPQSLYNSDLVEREK